MWYKKYNKYSGKNEGHYNIECSDNEFCFSIIIPQIHSLTS